jgi:transposase-like protein
VDTLIPGLAWRKREDLLMARKTYSAEFRRDAVELYRTTASATVARIEEHLRSWNAETGSGPANHPLLQLDQTDWGFANLTREQSTEIDAENMRTLRRPQSNSETA